MNRKIEFRGKCSHCDEWAYGNLVDYGDGEIPEIHGFDPYREGEEIWREITVDSDTVGQFTGLCDKNGVKIFEGDIVCKRDLTFNLQYKGVVVYNSSIGCFRIHSESKGTTMRMGFEASDVYNDGKCTVPVKYEYEVIGNIHDNPELLSTK